MFPKTRRIVPGSLNIEQVFELEAGDKIEFRSTGMGNGLHNDPYSIKGQVVRVDGEKIYYRNELQPYYENYHYHTDSGLVPYKGEGRWNNVWSVHLVAKKPTPIVVKFFGREFTLVPVEAEVTEKLWARNCKHRHVYLRGGSHQLCLRDNTTGSPIFIFSDNPWCDNTYFSGNNTMLANDFKLLGRLPDNNEKEYLCIKDLPQL